LADQAKIEPENKVIYTDHITFTVRVPEAYYLPVLVNREIATMETHMVDCRDQYTASDWNMLTNTYNNLALAKTK
jgi:hypothetical protein